MKKVDNEIENGIFISYKEITSCCTYEDFLNAVFHRYQKLVVIFHTTNCTSGEIHAKKV